MVRTATEGCFNNRAVVEVPSQYTEVSHEQKTITPVVRTATEGWFNNHAVVEVPSYGGAASITYLTEHPAAAATSDGRLG
ncbi:hypothetical protein J6590_062187 [Homalodisca vitripennis]|nr:hypothetical protein J6590_062187 [Homalodisca vitripennis]